MTEQEATQKRTLKSKLAQCTRATFTKLKPVCRKLNTVAKGWEKKTGISLWNSVKIFRGALREGMPGVVSEMTAVAAEKAAFGSKPLDGLSDEARSALYRTAWNQCVGYFKRGAAKAVLAKALLTNPISREPIDLTEAPPAEVRSIKEYSERAEVTEGRSTLAPTEATQTDDFRQWDERFEQLTEQHQTEITRQHPNEEKSNIHALARTLASEQLRSEIQQDVGKNQGQYFKMRGDRRVLSEGYRGFRERTDSKLTSAAEACTRPKIQSACRKEAELWRSSGEARAQSMQGEAQQKAQEQARQAEQRRREAEQQRQAQERQQQLEAERQREQQRQQEASMSRGQKR
ncbi:MAG: hypothetical protein IIX84_05030 [Oscillospiraceae bacterium]|nr:hypothetical protein [Oscillospiraceae bacterium]